MLNLFGIIILGCVFAILSNNTIDQTPKKRNYSTPTPYCPSCATKLSWNDMLPFWSYFRNRGKCPYCNATLPIRKLLVDFLEFAWVAFYIWKFGWSFEGSMAMLYGMALIGIIFLIKEKREIHDSLLMIMGMLAVIHFLAYNPDRFPEAAISMLLGIAALALYNLVKIFATDDSTFELTEIKLGALLGLFLGMELGLIALFFALAGGAVIGSINVKYFNKRSDEAMPQFSELMAAAGLIALLWGQEILTFYQSTIVG
ncbi:MAG: prepilin peptidase [Candidatus Marinimicrobia bacterium]|nr:prepilin peptidase [Candidatus Neomarinimicrobiota bacterium]